jgi:ribosomal protein S18 acetylase RimI-like enzyme
MMTDPPRTTLPLIASRIQQAARMMARAFQEDPFFTFVTPDPLRRARLLPWIFSKLLRYGQGYGRVDTTPGLEGLAIWLGPRQTSPSLVGILRSGMFLFPLKFSQREFARSKRLADYAARLHQKVAPGRHWYLYELGTDPATRGRGVGRSLLQPVLAQADKDALPCYLETCNEKNLSFYKQSGFTLFDHGKACPDGPDTWAMLRTPQIGPSGV